MIQGRTRTVILGILIAGNLFFLIFGGMIRGYSRTSRERYSERHQEEFRAEMDQMLAEEDYLTFYEFCEYHRTETQAGGSFAEYGPVRKLSEAYVEVYSDLTRVVMPGSEDPVPICAELARAMAYFSAVAKDPVKAAGSGAPEGSYGTGEQVDMPAGSRAETLFLEASRGMRTQMNEWFMTYAECEQPEAEALWGMKDAELTKWLSERLIKEED